MKNDVSITETEWKIMEVIWNKPMLTIGEIKENLEGNTWSDSTIKTLVRRLTQKGALAFDDTMGHYRYYSIVNEKECKTNETKNLIDRIYHGSVRMLMANLVSDSALTDEETKKLMEIIDKMDGGDNV